MTALNRLIHLNLRHWPLVALLSSALMLAIAHGFETFGQLMPCTLCLRQREVYWVAMAVAAAALVLRRTPLRAKIAPWADALLGLIFVFGTGLAIYHAGAEWHWWPGPTACASTGGGGGGVTTKDLNAILDGAAVKGPSCDKAAWVFLGLSMAGWNALVYAKLAVWSFIAAFREPRS
jgi:disulfide bond formation protein DsbB